MVQPHVLRSYLLCRPVLHECNVLSHELSEPVLGLRVVFQLNGVHPCYALDLLWLGAGIS